MNNEDALRQTLEAEASAVEVRPDALAQIRRRIRTRRSRWSPRGGLFLLTSGAAAGLAGAAAAAVVLAGDGPRTVAPPPPPGATVTAEPSRPPVTATPGVTAAPAPPPATSSPTGGPVTASLAVYYVGVDRLTAENGSPVYRPRLYREFHRLPAADGGPAGRTRAAVAAMLDRRTSADPDYAAPWPAGSRVRDVRVDAGTVTVDLTGVAAGTGVDPETARIAVQQLVWTATAASGEAGVRLLVDGRPVERLWGQVPTAGVLRRAAAASVVAPVWLISPQHDTAVGLSFDVHIAGIVPEATVQLRVRRAGAVVDERFLTLSAGPPRQGEGRVRLTLAPGTYVLEAYATSAVDGSVQHLDDHTVTVR